MLVAVNNPTVDHDVEAVLSSLAANGDGNSAAEVVAVGSLFSPPAATLARVEDQHMFFPARVDVKDDVAAVILEVQCRPTRIGRDVGDLHGHADAKVFHFYFAALRHRKRLHGLVGIGVNCCFNTCER